MENTNKFTIDLSRHFAFLERKQKRLRVLAKNGKALSKRQQKVFLICLKNIKIK